MNKIKNLVVVGDSFTADNPKYDIDIYQTYGGVISNKFNLNYVNLAKRGCGNYTIYRRVIEWICDNEDLLETTLFIIGWTTINRYNFWLNGTRNYWVDFPAKLFIDKKTGINSFTFTADDFTVDWSLYDRRKYHNNFINASAEFRKNIDLVLLLQLLFKNKNSPYIFFDALPFSGQYMIYNKSVSDPCNNIQVWKTLIDESNWYRHSKYRSFLSFTTNKDNSEMRATENDVHPSIGGHLSWGKYLIDHIIDNGIL